jgi:hypothetical protein
MDDVAYTSLKTAVKYGVAFIYIVINGEAALKSLASPSKDSSDDTSSDGIAVLGFIGITLFVWSGLLNSGINEMVTAFSTTPIAQP